MASPYTRGPVNTDDILTAVMDETRDGVTNEWLQGFPFTKKMMEQGNVEYIEGGDSYVLDIDWQNNDTVAWFNSSTVLSTAINQILSQARFSLKLIGGTIGITDEDEAKNKGRNARFSLIKSRLENLKNSFTEELEISFLAAAATDSKKIFSLHDVVDASNPTIGVNYGDIDRSTYGFWAATETAATTGFALSGIETVRTSANTVSRALTDPVNMHITTQILYESYQARLTPHEILNKVGDLEFEHLTFGGKPVFFSEQMLAQTWIGVNTKYLKFVIDNNMKFLNQPFVRVPGGVSKSSVVETRCQLVAKRCNAHFKITGQAQ